LHRPAICTQPLASPTHWHPPLDSMAIYDIPRWAGDSVVASVQGCGRVDQDKAHIQVPPRTLFFYSRFWFSRAFLGGVCFGHVHGEGMLVLIPGWFLQTLAEHGRGCLCSSPSIFDFSGFQLNTWFLILFSFFDQTRGLLVEHWFFCK